MIDHLIALVYQESEVTHSDIPQQYYNTCGNLHFHSVVGLLRLLVGVLGDGVGDGGPVDGELLGLARSANDEEISYMSKTIHKCIVEFLPHTTEIKTK